MIHFLASSGIRVGGLDGLELRQISEMPDGCRAVLVYEGTNQEYWTFLTPEASKALDEYINERRKRGEYINEASPVFRAHYQVAIEKVRSMSIKSIHLMLNRVVKKINRIKVGRRYNMMTAHSIRKRYSTILKMNKDISWAVSERLLGHQAYLDSSYFRPTKESLFLEWKKVANDLVIDNSEIIIQCQQARISELESDKDRRITTLEKNMERITALLEQAKGRKN